MLFVIVKMLYLPDFIVSLRPPLFMHEFKKVGLQDNLELRTLLSRILDIFGYTLK